MINVTERNKRVLQIRKQDDEALYKAGFEAGYKVGCEHSMKAYNEALDEILKRLQGGIER